jgi:predicted ATP-grasp superfamily ATP-dependent carboligase
MRLFVYELLCAGGLGPTPPSLRREGWAMLSAVAEDFARVPGVEVWTLLEESALPDVGHLCHRAAASTEACRFRTLAARADATLVIAPEFDELLEERSRSVLDVGGRLLGSLPAGIHLAADKWQLAQHWHEYRVPTPRTQRLPATLPAPAVCKPRYGAGSQATFLVRRSESWPAILHAAHAEWPAGELIAQPFMEGCAASVALLLGPGQSVALCPAAQHLSGDGRFHYQGGTLPLPPSLSLRATRLALDAVAHVPGLQGYVGVDVILGADGDDVAIEINPRLTTSYIGLRRCCRSNLAAAWLRVVRGEEIGALAWQEGIVRFRADGMCMGTSC